MDFPPVPVAGQQVVVFAAQSRTVSVGEVTTLDHEVLDDAVEG